MAAAKKKKKQLTPEQRRQRAQKQAVRGAFRYAGFDRVPEIAEKTYTYMGQTGEFDDAFIHENVFILVEYTVHGSDAVKGHLKKKKIFLDFILHDPEAFFSFLRSTYDKFDSRVKANGEFAKGRLILRIAYCSYNDIQSSTKVLFPELQFLDYPIVKYFEKINRTIKLSGQPELLQFLDIDPLDVRKDGAYGSPGASKKYHGSALPEEASGLPEGYKVVSFYCDPASLLKRAFVLRRKGWRASSEAYQRMLLPSKIEAIRRMIFKEKRVAVNNLIATLPGTVHPVDEKGNTIDVAKLDRTKPVRIQLPDEPNTLGVIDGQHRLFAYYVSKNDTVAEDALRKLQNLLVTGIIYPADIDDLERERFEAELFLSINSNQTSASSELTQEIKVLIDPFDPVSIAKQVMERLSDEEPLFGHVERYFYEKGKLKTSSIVSFGLRPLVKLDGGDSLVNLFQHADKAKLLSKTSKVVLREYIAFCSNKVAHFLKAVKHDVPDARWTSDRKVKDRVLVVTYINAFLITMRKLIEDGDKLDPVLLKTKLTGISKFPFKDYHSSQYNRMADKIFEKFFP